jgi:hypothetical protein
MRVYRTPVRHGRPVRIACINKTKHFNLGVPFGKLTAALQTCYDRHFLPVWGFPVKLYNTKTPKPADWQFIYLDDAEDAAGTFGYHDLTIHGRPVSFVFMKTILQNRETVSLTASHELFEMVIDPIANMWAEATGGREFAYEMCDAVEEDVFRVDGLEMSNFVYPTWFEPFKHPRGTKFDHLGLLKSPFSMTKGGYVIVKWRGKVKERFGSKAKARRFALEDRRGHRSEYRKPNGQRIAATR